MALCNQPEAFTSDLGDDQSRYLYNSIYFAMIDNAVTFSNGEILFVVSVSA